MCTCQKSNTKKNSDNNSRIIMPKAPIELAPYINEKIGPQPCFVNKISIKTKSNKKKLGE